MSILDQIYEWYEMSNWGYPGDPAILDRFCDVWSGAEEVVSKKLLEELQSSVSDYIGEECRNDFQAGFRMGARLMLDLCLPGDGCAVSFRSGAAVSTNDRTRG